MNADAVLKKMHVKPGMRLLVLNAPAELAQVFKSVPGEVQVDTAAQGLYPAVLLFVQSQAELAQLAPATIQTVYLDSLLWIAYPKRTSKIKTDIHRDQGWSPVFEAGWVPVTQIAIDETWSALRFRPKERVGK